MVGSGTNIDFVPDVGSFVHICLESETYVCSFSSEFLFSFELLNLYVYSMYALFLPFCSSRSAPPFLLFPGLAPVIAACSYIIRGRAQRARPLLLLYVLLLLLLLLGAEPKGLDPYCYCMFYYYYYYYYYYIRPIESMAAL